MQLIKLENISQIFGLHDATTIALDQVDLEVKKGEFVALMGPSGSGKTSLLNIIGLIAKPSQGLYAFAARETIQMSQSKKARIRQKEIGFIFQNYNLLPELTILDNVSLPLLYSANYSFLKRMRTVKKLLDRLGVYKKEFLYPHQLSGGQIQRVAIARALINQPSLVIADEPTGNLDSGNSEIIMDILQNLNQEEGNTIIIATHNPRLTKYADRIIYIQDGRIRINQKLKKNQQVDLGKMQDAIRRQDLRAKDKHKSQGKKDKGETAIHKGKAHKAGVSKAKKRG